ncbi:uncharacterized protein si:ch211-198c19.1 [Alosa sapidissima]|uniref:uncharacterized protein si:ch211-198c19.1 n=1 Tax=Alosa sapidissima TaxID=34773 RepID=UPI001C0A6706|nr:uncharacterized protein si:ch211-198c19.1 [Alosa sapidissima]
MAVNQLVLLVGVLLSLTGAASSLRTLNTVKELNDTGFGSPPPRHGYVLLLWYVQNCVDNNMVSLCNPKDGEYGFHYFRNNGKSGPLLPKLDKHDEYAYYSLGNLNSHHYKHAQDLPYEVRRYYDKHDPRSNMDRLLVKYFYNKNLIEEIYVSAHYESSQTYLIGPSLVSDLRHKRALHQPPSKQWHFTIVQSNNNRYDETM